MHREEEKAVIGVVSFFLFFIVFLAIYGMVLSKENSISRIQKEKEVIEDCLRVLSQDCRQKCQTFIGEDVLFVAKECDGKKNLRMYGYPCQWQRHILMAKA